MRMRWSIPLFVLIVVLAGAAFFLITARFVGRHLLSSLPEPGAFEGPDLVSGYTLQRSLRGPESFIADPAGNTIIPDPAADLTRVGITRIAVYGPIILGEVADFRSGVSRGFFFIDTTVPTIHRSLSEVEYRDRVREALMKHAGRDGAERSGGDGGAGAAWTDPPELLPADSFVGPEPAR